MKHTINLIQGPPWLLKTCYKNLSNTFCLNLYSILSLSIMEYHYSVHLLSLVIDRHLTFAPQNNNHSETRHFYCGILLLPVAFILVHSLYFFTVKYNNKTEAKTDN